MEKNKAGKRNRDDMGWWRGYDLKENLLISHDLKDLKMKDEVTSTSKARTFQVQAISSTKFLRQKKTSHF